MEGVTTDKLLKPKEEAVIKFLKYTLLGNLVFDGSQVTSLSTETNKDLITYLLEYMGLYPYEDSPLNYIYEEGIFSRKGLEEIIKSSGVVSLIENSEIDCFATICNVQGKKISAEYKCLNKMNEKEVIDTLLASSALPLVYGKQKVNGVKYRDGGLIDNTPLEPLYSCGCTHMVVVNLEYPFLKNGLGIAKYYITSKYKDMVRFDIYPQRDLY